MAQMKPTKKDSPTIHTGANPDNGPASEYTGFSFFPADTKDPIGKYTQPKMNPVSDAELMKAVSFEQYGNEGSPVAGKMNAKTPTQGVSMGAKGKDKNLNGEWSYRGFGAAIKGIKNYGPKA
jgi:hypothetical protein